MGIKNYYFHFINLREYKFSSSAVIIWQFRYIPVKQCQKEIQKLLNSFCNDLEY